MSIDTKFIGKTYPESTYEVGKEKIKEYAKAIKNPDPHYLDDHFAKKSKYGTIIAPPTFAVVFGAYLIEPVFNDKDLNLNMAMLVHGEQELEFLEVVKAGDSITTSAKIGAYFVFRFVRNWRKSLKAPSSGRDRLIRMRSGTWPGT